MPSSGIINVANVANVGSFIAQPQADVTIASGLLTVTQGYHIVSAESGTVGTIDRIALGAQAGTDTNGYMPRLTLRAAANHFIQVTHSTGTININGGASFQLSGNRLIDLVKVNTGNVWSTTDGLQVSSGVPVSTSGTQTLSNKTYENPVFTGTMEFDDTPFGFSAVEYKTHMAGTKTYTAAPVVIGSIALNESRVMTVHGYVNVVENSGTEFTGHRFSSWLARPGTGSIVLIGTEGNAIANTVAIGTPTLSVVANILTNTADITVTGVAGTLSWVTTYSHFDSGIRV